MSGRTSVTIAHRLSTAENADEVIVFDRGRVVQRGPHARLVADGGVDGRRSDGSLGRPADPLTDTGRMSETSGLDPAIADRLSATPTGWCPRWYSSTTPARC